MPADVAAVTVALSAGWVLTAPYALPWYTAIAWAPLALVPATFLDRALLAQLTVLTLAYVPGLVTGLSPRSRRSASAYVGTWLRYCWRPSSSRSCCGASDRGNPGRDRPSSARRLIASSRGSASIAATGGIAAPESFTTKPATRSTASAPIAGRSAGERA